MKSPKRDSATKGKNLCPLLFSHCRQYNMFFNKNLKRFWHVDQSWGTLYDLRYCSTEPHFWAHAPLHRICAPYSCARAFFSATSVVAHFFVAQLSHTFGPTRPCTVFAPLILQLRQSVFQRYIGRCALFCGNGPHFLGIEPMSIK